MKIRTLTKEALKRYSALGSEVQQKPNTPNPMACIEIDDLYIGVPLRSRLAMHGDLCGFITIENRERSNQYSGLDFRKMLILDEGDLNPGVHRIDKDEHKIIKKNKSKIVSQIRNFIRLYRWYALTGVFPHRMCENNFKWSTLQYFHRELGLPEKY